MSTDQLQLKYPVILIHGLGAQSKYGPIEYFYGIPKLLRDAKNQVLVVNLRAWNTVEHRAKQLKEQIEEAIPEGKVNLVGHSMGGLDARYVTAQLGFADRVASVTTIGTPHRGSSVCDIATGLLPNLAFEKADLLLKYLGSSTQALKQVTRSYCNGEFANLATDVPGVGYFSATTAIKSPVMTSSLPIFWLSHKVLYNLEGENDGFVSVESAKWGNHICTRHGDHYAQIGQFLGRSRGMDYMGFYRDIFKHLKKEGM